MYNPNTKQIDVEVEMPESGWSDRVMNNVLWGGTELGDIHDCKLDDKGFCDCRPEPEDFSEAK